MPKKKVESQGQIIDETRKARKEVWLEFKADEARFLKKTKDLVKKYGLQYATPTKKRKKISKRIAA